MTTARSYSGVIELVISGYGDPVPGDGILEDAFYAFADGGCGCVTSRATYGLTLSYSGCACAQECGPAKLSAFLPSFPRYSPEHVYVVQLDVGSTPTRLTFGNGNCTVSNSTGAYVIQIRERR